MKQFWIVAILTLLTAGCFAGSTVPNVPTDLTDRAMTCYNSGYVGMFTEVNQITVVSEGDTLYWSITTTCAGRRQPPPKPSIDPGFLHKPNPDTEYHTFNRSN